MNLAKPSDWIGVEARAVVIFMVFTLHITENFIQHYLH